MGRPHLLIFGIPVRFEPFFFVVVVLLGMGWSTDLRALLSWTVVATTSVLLHELGHAAAFRGFGSDAFIVLHGFGGATFGRVEGPLKSMLVSLAGPLSTLMLVGAPAYYLWHNEVISHPFGRLVLLQILFANVGWAVLNLLPILPLDGGLVLRGAVELVTRRDGTKVARVVSVFTGFAAAAFAFAVLDSVFAAFLFGFLAAQNLSMLSQSSDRLSGPGTTARDTLPEAAPGAAGTAPGERVAHGFPVSREGAPLATDPAALLKRGWVALASGRWMDARRLASAAHEQASESDLRRQARSLAAWAAVFAGDCDGARRELGPSEIDEEQDTLLLGSLSVLEGDLPRGSALLAQGLVSARDEEARRRGLRFVVRAGIAPEVAARLVNDIPDGRGLIPAMRLEKMLEAAGRDDLADRVREIIATAAR
ncbi:MAG: hypothetical protein KatS3mg008_0100 [Acidimicrobiales bacterium]|nr:MAG: hypothetical protein KatS3mg008_0100 [Acidimicrobiales bacterium]